MKEHNECTHVVTLPRRYVACSSTITCTGHLGTRPGPLAALAGRLQPAARPSRCCWWVRAPPRRLLRAAASCGAGATPAAATAAAAAAAAAGAAAAVARHAAGSRLVQGLQQAGKGWVLKTAGVRWTGGPAATVAADTNQLAAPRSPAIRGLGAATELPAPGTSQAALQQ